MHVIGLTGGVGTGKTTVSQMLQGLGAVLLDADVVGHQSYLAGTPAHRDMVAAFGEGILAPDGQIDRRKLGPIVFADPGALAKLNGIVHPRMRAMMQDRLGQLEREGVSVVVLEAAILFEARWEDLATEVWVTDAPEDVVIARLQSSRGWTEQQTRSRIASQLPRQERTRRAGVVIDTSRPLEDVRKQVETHWRQRIAPRAATPS
jgi:dephospho-CoA kinase